MSYRICSFNVPMGNSSSYEKLENIKKIIEDYNIDVIAFQEVNNIKAVERIASLLPNWKYILPETDFSDKEYAFLWNSTKFELDIIRDNPCTIKKHKGTFDRDPFMCILKCKHHSARLCLINVHFKQPNKPVEERREEYRTLVESIIPENMVKKTNYYTIALGDYNLNLHKGGQKRSDKIKEERTDLEGLKGRQIIIQSFQDELTSLVQTGSTENPDYEENIYANNYDHFSYDLFSVSPYVCDGPKRIDAVRKYYKEDNDKVKKYKENYSDHVPVIMDIEFRGEE